MPKFGPQGRITPETRTSKRIPPPASATCRPSDCSTNGSPPRQESDRSPTSGSQHDGHAATVAAPEHISGSEHGSGNEHASVDQDQSDTGAEVGTRGQEVPYHRCRSSGHSSSSPCVCMSGDEHSSEASSSTHSQPRTSNEHILEFLASLEAKKQRCSSHSQPEGTSCAHSPEPENRVDDNKADEPSTVERSDGDAAEKSVPTKPRKSLRFNPIVITYEVASSFEDGNTSPHGLVALQLPMESMLDKYGDPLPRYC